MTKRGVLRSGWLSEDIKAVTLYAEKNDLCLISKEDLIFLKMFNINASCKGYDELETPSKSKRHDTIVARRELNL